MNSKSINRNVLALTLSVFLGVSALSNFSAQAADPPKSADARMAAGQRVPLKLTDKAGKPISLDKLPPAERARVERIHKVVEDLAAADPAAKLKIECKYEKINGHKITCTITW